MTLKELFLLLKIGGVVAIIGAFVVCDIIIQVQKARLDKAETAIIELKSDLQKMQATIELERQLLTTAAAMAGQAEVENNELSVLLDTATDWGVCAVPSSISELWKDATTASASATAATHAAVPAAKP